MLLRNDETVIIPSAVEVEIVVEGVRMPSVTLGACVDVVISTYELTHSTY